MQGAVSRVATGVALLVLPIVSGSQAAPVDRRERFGELVAHLDPSTIHEASSADMLREVYALLDAEILESLASGGVFASPAFIQDRLDAFTETWGGMSMRALPLGHALIVTYQFSESALGSSVRVYGRRAGEAVVLGALEGQGAPSLRPLPPDGQGGARFVVVWEGPVASYGARALRVDLVREVAGSVRTTWSSSALFPEGLQARWYTSRGSELTIRHEARYPGWAPGCDGQTEHEDVYRLAADGARFVRVRRRDVNTWHRDLHAVVSRLLTALAAGDRAALARLVGDPSLRARLPASLRREPACDSPPGPGGRVAIAALTDAGQPWTLTFRGGGRQPWRLTSAAPTFQ